MMTNTDTMTAQIPSAFGMPASGRAHSVRTAVIAVAPTCAVAGESSALRVRQDVIAGGVGLGQGHFRGDPCLETTDLLRAISIGASRPRTPHRDPRPFCFRVRPTTTAHRKRQVRRRR